MVWEITEEDDSLACSALWVSENSIATEWAESMRECSFVRGQEMPGQVLDGAESVWVEHLADAVDSPRALAAAAAGLRSALAMPLRSAGGVVGVAEFFSATPTPRNAELLVMGEAVVARMADVLERHHAQQAVLDAGRALEIRVQQRTSELQQALEELDAAQIETVRRLSRAVEFRDEDIRLEGRIVAIADVYDALTSDRIYRPAMTRDQALSILRAGRGTHFDPTLLDHFLAGLGEDDPDAESRSGR